jgi:4-amino-4-deoxy-L-arabinose transferase-like glycosyltransferase
MQLYWRMNGEDRARTGVRPEPMRMGVFALITLIFLISTRWPLAPKYLYYFDSVNFALALDNFNPALHQPQPPGYPLFVALARVFHLWIAAPHFVFLVMGILAALGAVVLIRILAREMFGEPAGTLAAALLAANPACWLSGISNQIRLFLALGAVGVALLGWRALRQPAQSKPFWWACAALGIFAGFRPVEAVLLLPLLLWIWMAGGRRPGRLAIGAALFAAVVLPWLTYTMVAAGGPRPYLDTIRMYATDQFRGSSAIFGATRRPAANMLAQAVVWNFLGAAVWLAALPFLRRRSARTEWRRRGIFLAVWFVPPFLFSAFIHIGDPDHALTSIPVLCIVGGAVFAALLQRSSVTRVRVTVCAVVVVEAVLFFKPPLRLAKPSSYGAVAAIDRITTSAFAALDRLRGDGPLVILHYGSGVTWRQISYYYPDDYLLVLPESRATSTDARVPCEVRHRRPAAPVESADILLPPSRRIACLLPWNVKPNEMGNRAAWRREGPLYYTDGESGGFLQLGPYRLVTTPPHHDIAAR